MHFLFAAGNCDFYDGYFCVNFSGNAEDFVMIFIYNMQLVIRNALVLCTCFYLPGSRGMHTGLTYNSKLFVVCWLLTYPGSSQDFFFFP